ncbi:DUF3047 domain-containing protein [Proteobacteria bacterium 005FR1]|nr:DUF3047 domain-containing protein [Proteobacteria bacterium 005FR1]
MIVAASWAEADDRLAIGAFSSGDLGGWEGETFDGETQYDIAQEDGKRVLRAVSNDSASGLVKRQRIDLLSHPYLNWEWKVDRRLPPRREATEAGDDYPARIYLIVSGGWQFWKTRAVNYVWAHNAEKGSSWPNAFAGDSVTMLAIRNREDTVGVWHREKRNVLEDLRRIIGPDVRYVDAVALMTDTDNTDSSALSYYGDIVFTSE